MWEIPVFWMMGDRCLRRVAAKLRTDWVEQALGVRVLPGVSDVVMSITDGVVNLTRLFVVFITSDAGTVVIVVFSRAIRCGAERSSDWQWQLII